MSIIIIDQYFTGIPLHFIQIDPIETFSPVIIEYTLRLKMYYALE